MRRDVILDVAVRLFAESGFAGTTIDAIAAGAGVANRTVYTYFTDKEGMFLAGVERLHDYRSSIGEPGDLEDIATRIVFALHSDQAIALHRLVVAESTRFPQIAGTFYSRGPKESIAYLASLFTQDDNAGNSDGYEKAEMLFTLLLGESHRQRLLGLSEAPTLAQARAHARGVLTEFPVSGRGST